MRFSKTKAIVLSAVVTLLCVGLLVAATFALFTDTATTNVHLRAGTLDATLARTNLSGWQLDEDGQFVEFTEEEDVDLTNPTTTPVFRMENVAPTMYQVAEFTVGNNGSVAFDYSVSIDTVAAEGSASEALRDRLQITVTPSVTAEGISAKTFMLKDYAEQGQNIPLGTLIADTVEETNPTSTFTIRVKFTAGEPGEESSVFAGAEVTFNIVVDAVQVTAE